MRIWGLVLLALALVGCDQERLMVTEDTTFAVTDPNDHELVEWVGEALAQMQPQIPFKLSLAVGNVPGNRHWKVFRGEARTKRYPHALGRTNKPDMYIVLGIHVVPERQHQTLAHELAHSVGLEHEDAECAPPMKGLMRSVKNDVDASVVSLHSCELEKLGELYATQPE
jgi:hypothetical protein